MPTSIQATYTCKIYGDGTRPTVIRSPLTGPFRPAINDVQNLDGTFAFAHSFSIPVGVDGRPLAATCDVQAVGDPALLLGNLDVIAK